MSAKTYKAKQIPKSDYQTLNRNQVKKLKNMFQFSNRIKIDDVAKVLHIARDDLLDYLIANPDVIEGFELDGDYFVAKQDEDIDTFITSLDEEFEDWKENEITKKGKMETQVQKFCEKCGTRIDPASQDRLKKTGKIFCTNCGTKIELE